MQKYKFRFLTNEAMDFAYAMERIAKHEAEKKKMKKKEIKGFYALKVNTMLEQMLAQASIILMNDLQLLFIEYELIHALRVVIVNKNLDSPEALIDYLGSLEGEAFYAVIIQGYLGVLTSDKDKIKEAYDFYKECGVNFPFSLKKVYSLKEEAEPLRQRLLSAMRQFYDIYMPFEVAIGDDRHAIYDFYIKASQDQAHFIRSMEYIDFETFSANIDVIDMYIVPIVKGIVYTLNEDDETEKQHLDIFAGASAMRLFEEDAKEDYFRDRLKCLADDTKMEILKLLTEEPLYAKSLSEKLNLSKATISHHIDKLTDCGLIMVKLKEGKRMYYGVTESAIEEVIEKLNKAFL